LLEVTVDGEKVHVKATEGGPVTVRLYDRNYEIDGSGVSVGQRQPSMASGVATD
jgi:hypothetical protein